MNDQYIETDESLLRGQENKKKFSLGLNLFSSKSNSGKNTATSDYATLSASEYVNMDLDARKTQPQTQEKMQSSSNQGSGIANVSSKSNQESSIKPIQNTSSMPLQTQYPYQMQAYFTQQQPYLTNNSMMQSQQLNPNSLTTIATCFKCKTVMQIPAGAEKFRCPTCKEINIRGKEQQGYMQTYAQQPMQQSYMQPTYVQQPMQQSYLTQQPIQQSYVQPTQQTSVQPPKPQYQKVICGVCKTTLQYLPVSEYFKCVCGNINYLPLKQFSQQIPAPNTSNDSTNLMTSAQITSNIQAYGYNPPKNEKKQAISTIQTSDNRLQ